MGQLKKLLTPPGWSSSPRAQPPRELQEGGGGREMETTLPTARGAPLESSFTLNHKGNHDRSSEAEARILTEASEWTAVPGIRG